jgi:ubiquinone/menaquinone biosynthesis C-methylase UbiE/uncharacterized protein YbaR (Trm112 family)
MALELRTDPSDPSDPSAEADAPSLFPRDELIALLQCPCCHGPGDLVLSGDQLLCPVCRRRFDFRRGVPVLLCEDRDVAVMPDDHQSNAVNDSTLDWLDSLDGYSLNLGAGASARRPSRCIEVEYSVFKNTTAVADAHSLPFKDSTFDAVVSFNTFEHLMDPAQAAQELHRVLKPGGKLQLQTAFLQPLHEEPAHFYDATEYGVRHWFKDFDIDACFVPDNMSPIYALSWLAAEILWRVGAELGPRERVRVGSVPLGDWEGFWGSADTDWKPAATLARLSQSAQRGVSFGTELRARKPGRLVGAGPAVDKVWPADGFPRAELVAMLRCPCCHGPSGLVDDGDLLVCRDCSERFRSTRGVPVLVCEDRDVVVMPEDHRSNPIDAATLDWLDAVPGFSLNLGAGASNRRPSRCVEIEYSVFRHTTAVADAHNLPFKDDMFDAIVSFNTFEHLVDPVRAAKELYRVLKPGGRLQVQTAFLQPLHEEPAHFYNATEYGVRHWFADFDIETCAVPERMSPAYALAWLANHVLWHVERERGEKVSEMVGKISLRQWARYWEDPDTRHGFLPTVFALLTPSTRAHFAAGFEVRATKPVPA